MMISRILTFFWLALLLPRVSGSGPSLAPSQPHSDQQEYIIIGFAFEGGSPVESNPAIKTAIGDYVSQFLQSHLETDRTCNVGLQGFWLLADIQAGRPSHVSGTWKIDYFVDIFWHQSIDCSPSFVETYNNAIAAQQQSDTEFLQYLKAADLGFDDVSSLFWLSAFESYASTVPSGPLSYEPTVAPSAAATSFIPSIVPSFTESSLIPSIFPSSSGAHELDTIDFDVSFNVPGLITPPPADELDSIRFETDKYVSGPLWDFLDDDRTCGVGLLYLDFIQRPRAVVRAVPEGGFNLVLTFKAEVFWYQTYEGCFSSFAAPFNSAFQSRFDPVAYLDALKTVSPALKEVVEVMWGMAVEGTSPKPSQSPSPAPTVTENLSSIFPSFGSTSRGPTDALVPSLAPSGTSPSIFPSFGSTSRGPTDTLVPSLAPSGTSPSIVPSSLFSAAKTSIPTSELTSNPTEQVVPTLNPTEQVAPTLNPTKQVVPTLKPSAAKESCASLGACYLRNLNTGENVLLKGNYKYKANSGGSRGYSIRCDVNGSVNFVRFLFNGEQHTEYLAEYWMLGNSPDWVNDASYLEECGTKTIAVSGHTWREECFQHTIILETQC